MKNKYRDELKNAAYTKIRREVGNEKVRGWHVAEVGAACYSEGFDRGEEKEQRRAEVLLDIIDRILEQEPAPGSFCEEIDFWPLSLTQRDFQTLHKYREEDDKPNT